MNMELVSKLNNQNNCTNSITISGITINSPLNLDRKYIYT